MITRKDIRPVEYDLYYWDYMQNIDPDATIQQALEQGLEQSVQLLTTMHVNLSHC